jgi:hypothetical protein
VPKTTNEAVLTICSVNYLAKAQLLLRSYKTHHTEHQLVLVIVDRRTLVQTIDQDIEVIWAEDLGINQYKSFAFRYDVIEFNTNVKPTALKKLLHIYQKVIYLDPDMLVYGPLTPVHSALQEASIVVTPHYITPVLDGYKPDDLELLKFGSFNLGFIAVSQTKDAFDFLDWWESRCLNYGFYEPQSGLAVDQKWVEIAPCFFSSLSILRHPGINIAFWNLHERTLQLIGDRWVVNQAWPVLLVHFSSFDCRHPEHIAEKQSRWVTGSRPDFTALASIYAQDLLEEQKKFPTSTKYGWDYFDDGTRITPIMKKIYSALRESRFPTVDDPFAVDSAVYKFAHKSGLLSSSDRQPRRKNFRDLDNHKNQIRFVLLFFRFLLKLIGPDRYGDLMRFLAYISSIRNQGDMFRKQKYFDS